MTLIELNEVFDNYTDTDEFYLEEGFKFFKLSKRLYKYADKIEKQLISVDKKRRRGDISITKHQINYLKDLHKNIEKVADEVRDIEKKWDINKISKEDMKKEIEKIKKKYEPIFNTLKKETTKILLKEIGLGSLLTGLMLALTGVFNPFFLIGAATKVVADNA